MIMIMVNLFPSYYSVDFLILAGKTGMGEVEARLLKCSNSSRDVQRWILHGDPRVLSVCDKFVAGKLVQ